MPNQIPGITFLPTADAADRGLQRQGVEGDLGQAFKILSMRLPRFPGAKAIAPPNLMNSQGSQGLNPNAFNPMAAVFQALLAGMQPGGMQSGAMASGPRMQPPGAGPMMPGAPPNTPPPLITPGSEAGVAPETPPIPDYSRPRGNAPVIGYARRRVPSY